MRSSQTREGSARHENPESALSLARFLVTLFVVAWALRSFIVQPFNIPSGSMLPTLYIGDYLLVAKWPYGYSRYSFPFDFPSFGGRILSKLPKRGDVVVFRHPSAHEDLIKRVIAVPGDIVELRGGRVILNGRPLALQELPASAIPITANSPCKAVPPAQPSVVRVNGHANCQYRTYYETLPGGPSYTVLDQVAHGPADDFGPARVPTGDVFLMGDNRDDSLDSRFPTFEGGIGMVPVDHLIGRALVTFWSTDGSASFVKPWTWFSALRADRVGNGYTGAAQ